MNRAELRRQKKAEQKKTKVYTLTQEQLDTLKEEFKREFVDEAFILMLAMPLMGLRDEFGFGKVRLQRFMDMTVKKYEALCDDNPDYRFPLEEMIDVIKRETDYDLMQVVSERRKFYNARG